MKKNILIFSLLPLFICYFVMGFIDVVGVATGYIQKDFNLSETMSGFLPSMVFVWFLLLAIPLANLMNKLGRKNMVLLSMLVTFIGMILPFITRNNLDLYICFVAFALLGIGNTILQVSLNPLFSNLVSGKTLTSSITAGQVMKALSSFCGPFLAIYVAKQFGSWAYIFPCFGVITLLTAFWLFFTPVKKEIPAEKNSMRESFKILKNKTILLFFLGILAVVGLDVGINMLSPKILMQRLNLTLEDVAYAPSVYFACRTIGAFIGSAVLMKINPIRYFKIHIILGLATLILMTFAVDKLLLLILIGISGYAFSSIFGIIFSLAMQTLPEKTNEISGLMVTGIVGGAIFPPFMTWMTSLMNGNQAGAVIVLIIITCYLLYIPFNSQIKKIVR